MSRISRRASVRRHELRIDDLVVRLEKFLLKTPYRDGTTHVIFEPLDFIARLAALVPKPRVNLARFHVAQRIRAERPTLE